MLFTSHDRRFVENVATRFVEIEDGRLWEVSGPESYYAREAQPRSPASSKSEEVPAEPSREEKLTADACLARINVLEARLRADDEADPHPSRPHWERELARLYAQLERF